MNTRALKLTNVIFDMDYNPRYDLNYSTIERYAGIIESMPRMVAFDIPEKGITLVSGFHRYKAHELAGNKEAVFTIISGTDEEAKDYADKSNASNPLQLTDAELFEVGERALLRNPHIGRKQLQKEYGIGPAMAEDLRKKLHYNDSDFPLFPDADKMEEPASRVSPLDKERPWWELHFENIKAYRSRIEDRLSDCEVCGYSWSTVAHLLDQKAWGPNAHVKIICTRCHEAFDTMLREIEHSDKGRAPILMEKLRDEQSHNEWFVRLQALAQEVASTREMLLRERQLSLEHYQKQQKKVLQYMNGGTKNGR